MESSLSNSVDPIFSGARLLVVDDQEPVRAFFVTALEPRGVDVITAEDGLEAKELLETRTFDAVISDVKMPRMDGMELLKYCIGYQPSVPVILLTAFGTIEKAVEAMRFGAFDYLAKPVLDIDQVDYVVRRALRHRRLLIENQQLRTALGERQILDRLVGPGPKMQRIFDIINTVARTQTTILVTGASGTGKELVARAIHFLSARANGPFVKVNCGALPEGLIESELFGHEKGAFTGALKTTKGRFETADGGTLLLDEIGELPLGLQPKMLRALQEREFERIGSPHPVKVDVRVVATTNVDLEKAVQQRRFREDLFYRLNVIPIKLPTLTERPEDIPVLAYHFLRRYARMHERPVERISQPAMNYLLHAPWPGNVRELENSIERAVVLCRGNQIELGDFFLMDEPPIEFAGTSVSVSMPVSFASDSDGLLTLAEIEKRHILATLEHFQGQRQRTADQLGISIRTLRNKLNEYRLGGIDSPAA